MHNERETHNESERERERERERKREIREEGWGRKLTLFPCFSASDGIGERKVVAPVAAGEKVSHT